MYRPRHRLTFLLLAFAAIVSLTMCKKHMAAPDPDDVVETKPANLIAVIDSVNEAFGGYYISLPALYAQTKKSYPILFFFHGLGQTGNGSTDLHYLLDDGIGKLLRDSIFPVDFLVNGKHFSMIVVSPQYSVQPTSHQMVEFMTHIMSTYRADQKRLYVSGLSLGARLTTFLAGTYAKDFAAIVPIAGVATNPGGEQRCKVIAENNLPVWAFHNEDDPLASLDDATSFINQITAYHPAVLPRMTIFNVYGHDAWTTALDPHYREGGKNMYEWMLQFSR